VQDNLFVSEVAVLATCMHQQFKYVFQGCTDFLLRSTDSIHNIVYYITKESRFQDPFLPHQGRYGRW
jgi:hypothetical protein